MTTDYTNFAKLRQFTREAALKFITDKINARTSIELMDNDELEDEDFEPDAIDTLPIFEHNGSEYRIVHLYIHPTFNIPYCTGFECWPEADVDNTEDASVQDLSTDNLCDLAQYLVDTL